MYEQAQTAVLAWQQAVNEAWDRQVSALQDVLATAPPPPPAQETALDAVLDFGGDVLDGVANFGADVINGAASFGNAALNNPDLVLAAAGGIGLTALSGGGEFLGVGLSLTGGGAVAGVPLAAVSAAGVAAGTTTTAVALAAIAEQAAGADRVEPIQVNSEFPPRHARDRVPEGWGDGKPNRDGVGRRWTEPGNQGNGIRIDEGNPNHSLPSQQVDHVVVRRDGRVIGRDGQPIEGSIKENWDNAHIPLEEWLRWSRWDQP